MNPSHAYFDGTIRSHLINFLVMPFIATVTQGDGMTPNLNFCLFNISSDNDLL